MALRTVIKALGLAREYLSMSPAEKKLLDKYHYTGEVISVVQRETCKQDDPFLGEAFRVDTAARLLWVTAANSIPHGQWYFAEKLLHLALELADDSPDSVRDLAHIHANLAQLYADQVTVNPTAVAKCLYHSRETIKTGYFVNWAENLSDKIQENMKGTLS